MNIGNHECFRTGDINFFAACMSVGIPPLPEAAEVNAVSDGKNYHQFRLGTASEDGACRTLVLDRAWNNPIPFKAECPGHPFGLLMDFIASARGSRPKEEWIEKGAAFLGVSRDAVRKGVADTRPLEANAPESPLSYVCCFIANRFAAVDWVKGAVPKEVIYSGPAICMTDGRLNKETVRQLRNNL